VLDARKVQTVLEIQPDFARNLKQQKPAAVQIIVDGRQTNTAGIVSGYASQIVAQYSANRAGASGGSGVGGSGGAPPLNIVVKNWYNPNLIYLWYFLTSIIVLLSVTVVLALTAFSIAREREQGTFEQLIVSPLTSVEILIGKTVPPLLLSTGITSVMILIILFYFKVPFSGNLFLLFVAMVITLFSFVGVGLYVSSICKTQQQAMLGVFTFQMPATLLSGFISPVEDMPQILQYITYLNPMRFYMKLSKGIFLKDMDASAVFANLAPVIIIAAITLSLANWSFKRKLD